MKKKIAAIVLSLLTLTASVAYAEVISVTDNGASLVFEQPSETRAVIACYDDNGTLCYGGMATSIDGWFTAQIPDSFKGMKTKIYFVNSRKIMEAEITEGEEVAAPTATPQVSAEPTEAPEATAAPTATQAPSQSKYPAVYEKAVDAIYAPAVVKSVETRSGKDDDIYAVTVLHLGKEYVIAVDTDFGITSAPEEYSYMQNAPASALEEGDVICVTANIAGDEVRTIDFIYRPQDEDIVTGNNNFGTNFEKLISTNGSSVAGKWKVMQYGSKMTSDRYQYAFGVVARKNSSLLTLLNKNGDADEALEIYIADGAMVYTCDVSNKNEVEIGSVADIVTTIPRSMFDNNNIVWETDTSYNYALVRLVDGEATDIVLYNNYND